MEYSKNLKKLCLVFNENKIVYNDKNRDVDGLRVLKYTVSGVNSIEEV